MNKIADYNSLKDTFIIGRNPVSEGLKQIGKIEKVWIDKVIRGEFEKEIRHTCRKLGINLQVVPKEKLDYISRSKNHQGIVAQVSLLQYYDLNDIIQFTYEQGEQPFLLILDGVEDVRNFGALARSAHWFGVHGIVVPKRKSARINAIAVKSSAGALLKAKISKVDHLIRAIEELKEMGMIILGADMNGELIDQNKVDFIDKPTALIMGAEGYGLSSAVKEACHYLVAVDGAKQMESLNVSVAGGILMHQIFIERKRTEN